MIEKPKKFTYFVIFSLLVQCLFISSIYVESKPIPQGPLYQLLPESVKYIRNSDFSNNYSCKISNITIIPQHPYMAENGGNNMHGDSYMSDYYIQSGPVGNNTIINSTYRGIAECVTVTFTKQGQMVVGCTSLDRPRLVMLNSTTLEEIASYDLPKRPVLSIFDPIGIFEDTSGGAYFYLDNLDRVVVATHEQAIEVVQVNNNDTFKLVKKYDLSDYVVKRNFPERDKVGCALPDWSGNIWFVSRYGAVGLINETNGNISSIELKVPGYDHYEEIQNSFTIGEDGVYIVSDYALYRFNIDESGNPKIDWRAEYDRGTRRKPGMLNQGSGTTPTLVSDLVAIGDNADPKMNVELYYRNNGTLACSIPVFKDNKSCVENSFIGLSRKNGTHSLILVNSYGHKNMFSAAFGRTPEPGITRIDIIPTIDGYLCKKIWTSDIIPVSALPKLSLGNGLIYLYTKNPNPLFLDFWYFTAVDFKTGKMVFKKLVGTGITYNNNWGPINMGPDGTVYIGMLLGLVSVRDSI